MWRNPRCYGLPKNRLSGSVQPSIGFEEELLTKSVVCSYIAKTYESSR